jgi:hypothetical protein
VAIRRRIKRRVELTVSRHESLTTVRRPDPVQVWCPRCGAEVQMVTMDEAAALFGVPRATASDWWESGKLHYTNGPTGAISICLRSLEAMAFGR